MLERIVGTKAGIGLRVTVERIDTIDTTRTSLRQYLSFQEDQIAKP